VDLSIGIIKSTGIGFCEAYYEKELIFTINSFSHSLTLSISFSRLLLSAIAMNGADLNSTALPWNEAKYRTKELFEEFYSQGDIELQQGREPNPLMDRRKADEQPKSQVEFLSNITIPCLQVIKDLLPDVYRYLNNCL
jgi:hypothetical protein